MEEPGKVTLSYLASLAVDKELEQLARMRLASYKGKDGPIQKVLVPDASDDTAFQLMKRNGIWSRWHRQLQGNENAFTGVIMVNAEGAPAQVRIEATPTQLTFTLLNAR